MPEITLPSQTFLKPGDVVNIGIDLPGRTFAEDQATVVRTDRGEVLLNLCSRGFPAHLPLNGGSRVVITRGEGRELFHCTALLKEPSVDCLLRIELPESVTVRERREHARNDVFLAVHYSLPASQELGQVITEWEQFKECGGECHRDNPGFIACGNSRVNLSGSGLRFKIRDCLSYGTLLHVNIRLPGQEPDHIHAVGNIIRTKELLKEMDRVEYYSTSMSFRMIDSRDRMNLIRHIFAEQHKFISPDQPANC
jgi:hypothetical protein